MLKIGKKNRLCRICILPVIVVGMFTLHGIIYCRSNGKRFVMLTMTFLLFAVYSSFSFPVFISQENTGNGLNSIADEAMDITFAEEAEINLEDFEILEDDDVLLDDEGILGVSASAVISETVVPKVSQAKEEDSDRMKLDVSEFSKDDWRLILINKQHSIPDDYSVTLGSVSTIKGTMYCDERIVEDWLAMQQAAADENVVVEICSPYRDLEYQQMLFDRKIKRYMGRGMSYMEAYQMASQAVTVPNASEHQIGLALDIVTSNYRTLDEGFAQTAAGTWLAENSYKYGFILRYPKGKEYITGIEFEPWHFRYVGVEAATVITEAGITLEEFWEEIVE